MRVLVLVLLAASILTLSPPAAAEACDLGDVSDADLLSYAHCQRARAECYVWAIVNLQGECTM